LKIGSRNFEEQKKRRTDALIFQIKGLKN
jgi:hypothetical protein